MRLGVVSYLNTAPVFHALRAGLVPSPTRLEFVPGEPAEINAMFRLGRVDVAPISSVELRDDDLVLPDLSISARGPVRSVALFSRLPLEKLDGVKVGLTPASASAASLLKVLCWGFLKVRPDFVLMKSCEEVEAALMIGDRCLLERSFDRWPYVTDLAEEWVERTGLPISFALFAHRPRGIGAKRIEGAEDRERLAAVARALRESRDWGVANLEKVVDGVELPTGVGRAAAIAYLRSIDYTLSGDLLKGLKLFLSLVRKHGIGMPPEELRFIDS